MATLRCQPFPRHAAALLMAAGIPCAWAQAATPPIGTITYTGLSVAAQPMPVPTLSQWGLIVALALQLALLAWHLLRGHKRFTIRSAGLGLLAAAALTATPWGNLPAVAMPVPGGDVLLDNAAGGSAAIPYDQSLDMAFADYQHEYEVRNTSSQSLRIRTMSVTASHVLRAPRGDSACTEGQNLAPGASCFIKVYKPHN